MAEYHPGIEEAREAREKAREVREAAEEKRRQEEHDAKLKRDQEEHDADMAAKKKALEKDDEKFDAVQMALLAALAKLLETGNEFAQVAKGQYEFGGIMQMRAAACELIRKAALQVGTPEALQEAADKILSIAESVGETKKAAKAA